MCMPAVWNSRSASPRRRDSGPCATRTDWTRACGTSCQRRTSQPCCDTTRYWSWPQRRNGPENGCSQRARRGAGEQLDGRRSRPAARSPPSATCTCSMEPAGSRMVETPGLVLVVGDRAPADHLDVDAVQPEQPPHRRLAQLGGLDAPRRQRLAGEAGEAAGDPQPVLTAGEGVVELAGDPAADEPEQAADGRDGGREQHPPLADREADARRTARRRARCSRTRGT